MKFSYSRALGLMSLGAISSLSCAQVLGLSDYKETNASGGAGGSASSVTGVTVTGSTSSSPVVGSTTGSTPSNASASSTGGAGGMGPAPGTVVWAKSFGDATDQEAARVAVSPSGQIYVLLRGANPNSSGNIIALDPQGNQLWSSTEPFGEVYGLAADDNGVVVAGMNQQSVTFSSGPEQGFYFARVGTTGTLAWVKSCGGYEAEPPFDQSGDVTVSASGVATFVGNVGDLGCGSPSASGIAMLSATPTGVITRGLVVQNTTYTAVAGVAGNAAGDFALGVPTGTVNLDFSNKTAPLIAKFTQANTNSAAFVNLLPIASQKLSFDKTGELYAAGEFTGTVSFGNTQLQAVAKDIFVTSYDGTGAQLNARSYGGQGDQFLATQAIDKSHNLLLGGAYTGEAHFGAASVSDGAFYIAKVDSSASAVWVDSFGTPTLDTIDRVVVDNNNRVIVVGGFKSPTVVFGAQTLANAGGSDAFVAVIAP